MRDQLRGMRVEMEKLRSDIGEVEKTLSERIEDLDTNLNTVVYHQQKNWHAIHSSGPRIHSNGARGCGTKTPLGQRPSL
jgi:uncharacterized protein YkvS